MKNQQYNLTIECIWCTINGFILYHKKDSFRNCICTSYCSHSRNCFAYGKTIWETALFMFTIL